MKISTLESNDLIAPELTHMDLHGVCDGLQRAVARTVLVHQVEPCNLMGKLLSISVSSKKNWCPF